MKKQSKDEIRRAWNEKVKKLPPVDEDKKYKCSNCNEEYDLNTASIEIGAYGVDIECPQCEGTIGFEPLGYSKWE